MFLFLLCTEYYYMLVVSFLVIKSHLACKTTIRNNELKFLIFSVLYFCSGTVFPEVSIRPSRRATSSPMVLERQAPASSSVTNPDLHSNVACCLQLDFICTPPASRTALLLTNPNTSCFPSTNAHYSQPPFPVWRFQTVTPATSQI